MRDKKNRKSKERKPKAPETNGNGIARAVTISDTNPTASNDQHMATNGSNGSVSPTNGHNSQQLPSEALSKVVSEISFPSPIVWSVEAELCRDYCNFCMRAPKAGGRLCRCSGCKFAHFCDASCQRAAWAEAAGHRAECARLQAAFPQAPCTSTLFFARLLDWLAAEGVRIDEETITPPSGVRSWANLMTHSEAMRSQPDRIASFFSLRKMLTSFCGRLEISDSDLWAMYCKKSVNCHGVFNFRGECIGQAMDLQASLYDHSCRPNLSMDFDGKRLILRSLEAGLDVRDVGAAFVTYAEPLKDGLRRREDLRTNYAFTCACDRCKDPRDMELVSLRCQSGVCGGRVAYFGKGDESAVCADCGAKMGRRDFAHAVSLMAQIPDKIDGGLLGKEDKGSIFAAEKELEAMEALIADATEFLHPANTYLIDLYVAYFQTAISSGLNYASALRYSRLALPAFRFCYHARHKKLAFHLLRLVLLELRTAEPHAAASWRSKAAEARHIFAAWFGEAHAFTANVDAFLAALAQAEAQFPGRPHFPPQVTDNLLSSLRF